MLNNILQLYVTPYFKNNKPTEFKYHFKTVKLQPPQVAPRFELMILPVIVCITMHYSWLLRLNVFEVL